MKHIYSKYFIYSVFLLTILSLYTIFSQVFNSSKNKLRYLAEDGLEDLCKKNEDIYNYYYKGGDYEIIGENLGKINSKSQIILDFINNKFKIKYIFKYFFRTGTYVFFLLLLIIIIILTIYYSFASCIRCCSEKCCDFFSFSCCKKKCLKKISCILIPFVYLIVFIFSLISIVLIIAAIQRLPGVVCVGMQLVDSFIEGEIRQSRPKWAGIEIITGVLDKLANLTSVNNEQLVNDINSNRIGYFDELIKWRNYWNESYYNYSEEYFNLTSPKMFKDDNEKVYNIAPEYSYYWKNILDNIYEHDYYNDLNIIRVIEIIDSSLYGFLGCHYVDDINIQCEPDSTLSPLFKEASKIVKGLKDPLTDLKDKITTPLHNIYDQIASTVVTIFVILMIFVICYCITIEILLGIFCCAKNCKRLSCFIKWFLCFIYYTSIFIVIIGFILGIVIGFIGDVFTNLTNVVKFISSTENLMSSNPVIFGHNSYTEYLDVCINGNGNIAVKLGLVEGLDQAENITEINDDTAKYINESKNETSPIVDAYLDYFEKLNEKFLEIQYIENSTNSNFSIKDRINEINKYVSGSYANTRECISMINETWDIINKKEGYEYNNEYPPANINKHYLLYLYDEVFYKNNIFKNRYNEFCPTNDAAAYETVNDASDKFGEFFKNIRENVFSEKFYDKYRNYLKEFNNIFGKKNKYLHNALELSYQPITNVENAYSEFTSGSNSFSNLLNCKFVGNNTIILIDLLHTSLGLYLDAFGIITCLLSLFIFIGVVFILIIVKNTKLDDKNAVSNMNIESLNNILKGNDEKEATTKREKIRELMPIN